MNLNKAGSLKLLRDVFGDRKKDEIEGFIEHLPAALETLDEREQCVLKKRYYENNTLKDTGKSLIRAIGNPCDGVGKERARSIQYRAIRKLRHPTRKRILEGRSSLKEFFSTELAASGKDAPFICSIENSDLFMSNSADFEAIKQSPVCDLADFSVRTMNCFKNSGINTVGDLLNKSEKEMLRIKNFGRKSLNEVKNALGLI